MNTSQLRYDFGEDASPVSAQSDPPVTVNLFEAVSKGNDFLYGNLLYHVKKGGSGHRETLHAELATHQATAGDQLVAVHARARVVDGSGSVFGLNASSETEQVADASSECVGIEVNTQARSTVARKVGIQLIDQGEGTGSAYDAGLLVAKSGTGTAGYKTGVDLTGLGLLHKQAITLPQQGGLWFGEGATAGPKIESHTNTSVSLILSDEGITIQAGGTTIFQVNTTEALVKIDGALRRLEVDPDGFVKAQIVQ